MDLQIIITELKEQFADIKAGAGEQALRMQLNAVIRNINRLSKLIPDQSKTLIKLSADLNSLFTSQKAFNKMQTAPHGEKFDLSFFRALTVLKEELFTLLNSVK